MSRDIFGMRQFQAGRKCDPPTYAEHFYNYEGLGGEKTGSNEAGWQSRDVVLEFEKTCSAIVTSTIDIAKKSSSNSN